MCYFQKTPKTSTSKKKNRIISLITLTHKSSVPANNRSSKSKTEILEKVWIRSKLTIKIPERCHLRCSFLVFSLLALNRQMISGIFYRASFRSFPAFVCGENMELTHGQTHFKSLASTCWKILKVWLAILGHYTLNR